jgi:phosphoglycolate phosphatase
MVIAFDFDGTIADSFPIFVTCMNHLSREFGYEKLKDSVHLRRKGVKGIALEDLKVPLAIWPTYAHRLREEIKNRFREIPLFPSIKPVIKSLMPCHTVGILSMNSEAIIRNTLKKEGFHVDFLLTDVSYSEKAEALMEIKRRNIDHAAELIYIGDECRDIEACKKAGIRIIAVTWGFDPREMLEQNHPDHLVDDPSELLTLLNRLEE